MASDDQTRSADLPSQPIRLPEITKDSLREWVETKNPEAFETFLTSLTAVVEVSAESHSGPLPPPAVLREYNDVLPGLAERIVRLAERPQEALRAEQKHRHEMEGEIVSRTVAYRDRGLWMGFAVAIIAICAAFFCALNREWIGAAAFLCLPLAGVVSVLVSGKPWNSADAAEKKTQKEADKA